MEKLLQACVVKQKHYHNLHECKVFFVNTETYVPDNEF